MIAQKSRHSLTRYTSYYTYPYLHFHNSNTHTFTLSNIVGIHSCIAHEACVHSNKHNSKELSFTYKLHPRKEKISSAPTSSNWKNYLQATFSKKENSKGFDTCRVKNWHTNYILEKGKSQVSNEKLITGNSSLGISLSVVYIIGDSY